MKRFARENSLGLFFGGLFLVALAGQAIAGHISYNDEQLSHGGEAISLGRYLTSSEFGQAVMENWQSEYLQFLLFLMATVWVLQKGSPESKPLDKAGRESDKEQMIGGHAKSDSPRWAKAGGWRAGIYGNSLMIVMALIFLGSWLAQSLTGWNAYNQEQADHHAEQDQLDRLPRQCRFLADHASKLAVGVPSGRLLRGLRRLPAPARIARVKARRGSPLRYRHGGISAVRGIAIFTRSFRGGKLGTPGSGKQTTSKEGKLMAEITTLEEKLAEVTGLARAAKDATEKVEGLIDDQSVVENLQRMHQEAAETDDRCSEIIDRREGKKTAIFEKAQETKSEAGEMMSTYLGEDSDGLDGLEFMTMAEAGEVGHWAILGKLNEKAGEEEIASLVEWALPIQERHLSDVQECSLALAAKENPDS